METYRGGSTNQGLRRLLRKYAEGGPFPEPALRDEDTYGPDTGQYRTDRAQATSDVVKAALAKSNAAMAARPMEPDLMGYQTRQAPEGYWYDDAGFMRNPQGQEVTPERRPSVIPFDKYGDFTNSKLLELAGNLSGGILAPVRGAQGAFLLGSGPVRKAVEVAAQQVPRELSPLGFYSHGAETAANLAQAKGAPDQMTAMLRKYGVKPDELYNAGIADETATNVMRSKIEREYAPKLAAAKLEMDALGLNENTINKKSPDYNKALEIRQSPETKAKYQYDSTLNAMRSDMDSAMVLHPEWSARPSVTREELAKHFKERRPQVEETVLGAKANKYPYRDADEWQTAINQAERRRDFDEAERLTLAWEESEGIGAQGAPKFQKYTLPGGENYREVLLKTPDESGALRKETAEAASLRTQAVADYANAAPGSPEAVEAQDRIKKYVKLHNELIDKKFSMPPTEYRSQHWDDPNVLAHLRMADRTGPNGEKILHVEEIQSDWGQKGKKEGFDKPKVDLKPFEADRELARMASVRLAQNMIERESGGRFNSLSEVLDSGDVDLINRMRAAKKTDPELIAANETFQAADRALQEARAGNRSNIPSAPYVTNTAAWTDLALKRALKEAAEGGYDKLVWTPGAEQAKRYDLSKQISRLVLENDPAGGHKLRAYSPSGDQVINKRIVDADRELPDLIGKEVAKKLLDQDLVNPKVFNEKLTSNDIIVVPKEGRYQISAPWGWSTHVGMGVVNSPEAAAEYGARHFSNLAKEANSNMGTSHATEYKNATRSLIGQDLSVGGEGMKGYYDKIVPNQLSKLVKKLDPEAKIGTHEIRTTKESDLRRKLRDAGYDPDQVDLQEILADSGGSTPRGFTETDLDAIEMGKHLEGTSLKSISAPSLTITPKMREAIMKGQTEFARGGSVKGYALGGQADIAQANIDLLNEMARRYNLTAGDGSVAADAQSQAEADRYAEMAAAINAGVERGDNSLFGNANQQTPTSTNFTTNTPATVAYDPRANDMVPYSNTNYMPNAVQSYNLSNLSPSQQAAVITSSQTNPTSTQTAAITPTTNTNVAALPSTIEGFAPSSKGVGNLVSPGFTASDKIASRAGEALPGYLGPLQQAFFDESKALMGAYGTLPSSVTNVAIQPEQLADWLAVQQEMFGDERAAAINQGIINGDLSLFGEGQTPNVGAPQENFNGSVAGTNIAGTFDPLASPDVLGDISYGTFGLSGPMGLSNAIQEMQDQQEDSGPEDGGDSGPEDGGDGDSSGSESDSSGSDDNGGADGDYALGGTVNKDLMKLYRKYSKKSRKYAQGGPVAVYDPAEIDAIAARIREGNYA